MSDLAQRFNAYRTVYGPNRTARNELVRAVLESDYDALLARCEAAERDAARYRWLAGADVPAHSVRWSRWNLSYWAGFHGGWMPLTGTELDDRIDAALAAQEPPR